MRRASLKVCNLTPIPQSAIMQYNIYMNEMSFLPFKFSFISTRNQFRICCFKIISNLMWPSVCFVCVELRKLDFVFSSGHYWSENLWVLLGFIEFRSYEYFVTSRFCSTKKFNIKNFSFLQVNYVEQWKLKFTADIRKDNTRGM